MSSSIQTVPTRRGAAIAVKAGQKIKITNTHGNQVVDTWALALPSSILTTASSKVEAALYPDATAESHTCSGRRDGQPETGTNGEAGRGYEPRDALHSLYTASSLAAEEKEALEMLQGKLGARVPDPFNLFINVPSTREGEGAKRCVSFEEPKAKPGDYVVLEALRDVVVVMSACPQDVPTINGKNPVDTHFQVLN